MSDALAAAMREHEAALKPGVRVRVRRGECPPGSINGCMGHFDEQDGRTGRIVNDHAFSISFSQSVYWFQGQRRSMATMDIAGPAEREHRFTVEYDEPIRLSEFVAPSHGYYCAAELVPLPVESRPAGEEQGGE